MERQSTQQEILLMTGSTFFQHQLCEKNESDSNKHLSYKEQLEEACWNGMLDELLPGIVEKSVEGKTLLLWQIRHCNAFLEIDLMETPMEADPFYSVDPYLFLQASYNN